MKLYSPTGAERCGLIIGTRIHETRNIAEDTSVSFEIPPEELVKFEEEMTGTWHTHPGATANLSHADYEGFSAWPRLSHFIVGSDGVAEYKIGPENLIYRCE